MGMGDDITRMMLERGIIRLVGWAMGEGDSAQDSEVYYIDQEGEKAWLDAGNSFDPTTVWDEDISDWSEAHKYCEVLEHGDTLKDKVNDYMMSHSAFYVNNEGSRLYFSADLTQEVPIRVRVLYPETTWEVGYDNRE